MERTAKHVPFLDMIRQGFFADGPHPSEIAAVNWRRTGVHDVYENRASQAGCRKTYTWTRQCTITHGLPLAQLNIRPAGLVRSVETSCLPSSLLCCTVADTGHAALARPGKANDIICR
jgi:hypothetical protein